MENSGERASGDKTSKRRQADSRSVVQIAATRSLTGQLPAASSLQSRLFRSIAPWSCFDPSHLPDRAQGQMRNGIFGLEFAPDGSTLAVAAENHSISYFDPLLPPRPYLTVRAAHRDCVNYIRFLDARMHASCSDDQTVKLWDLRQMKSEIRCFTGHSSWVKSVEFARDRTALITAAFDHNVYSWDINEANCAPKKLLNADGLMRMRLTEDGEKMIVSTQNGYILVIHDLDLDTLADDLRGFKPNNLWIAIETRSMFPPNPEHLKRFTATRNRTELITDFPVECTPDHISCIAPHPHGWAIAARMNNMDDRSEWTTVHDMQLPPREPVEEEARGSGREESEKSDVEDGGELALDELADYQGAARARIHQPERRAMIRVRTAETRHQRTLATATIWADEDSSGSDDDTGLAVDPFIYRRSLTGRFAPTAVLHPAIADVAQSRVNLNAPPVSRIGASLASTSTAASSSAIVGDGSSTSQQLPSAILVGGGGGPIRRAIRALPRAEVRIMNNASLSGRVGTANHLRTLFIYNASSGSSRSLGPIGRYRRSSTHTTSPSDEMMDDTVVPPPPTFRRLSHYREEPRQGRGFIKELCWSPCGRLIASPFAFGCRLLGFDEQCREIADVHWASTRRPQQLVEVKSLIGMGHSEVVLCTKFSPIHECFLAVGCLQGKLSFCQPHL